MFILHCLYPYITMVQAKCQLENPSKEEFIEGFISVEDIFWAIWSHKSFQA